MPPDDRSPVLVGCAQIQQRADDLTRAKEPLELMREALERASADCGSESLVRAADSIRVPHGMWRYPNPAAWLAERFGMRPGVHTGLGPISGSTVQRMLHHGAVEIAKGERDVVVLASAECEHSRRRAKKAGVDLGWSTPEGPPVDERFGSHDPDFTPLEMQYRLRPTHAFSLYENALRAELGESPAEHQQRIAELWARLAAIAAGNPDAWNRDGLDARAIQTPEDGNRMVAYPYTKYLVSNMVVDMAAGLVMCSASAARRHGVPEDRWVYLHAATDVLRTEPMASRETLHQEPAMGHAGRRALELAGRTPEEIDHVDLYSCFPAAVQIAAREIGFGTDRDLSVTGGLTFSGGPFNSYVMHSLTKLVERLRERPETTGFASGVGGYMAKHAFGVYGAAPPEHGFRYEDCTEAVRPIPTRPWELSIDGEGSVESFAQIPDPETAEPAVLAACLHDDGRRSFALRTDPEVVAGLAERELCGTRIRTREARWEAA